MKFFNIVLLLATLLLAAPEREQVDITFKNLKIDDFLKMSAKILNKNILITDAIPGEVNFISTSPIYKDEILDLIIAILETKGYTLVMDGRFLKTVKTSVASRENLPVVEKAKGSMMVTQAITLSNQNVDVVVQKIRHLISNSAKLVTMKETNTLLITDYPRNIETINKIMAIISVAVDMETEFIKLKYAKAAPVFAHITTVSKILLNPAVEQDKITVLKDDTTNSLILIASRPNIDKLKPIIEKLDVEEDFASQKIEVIKLQNSEAKNVAKLINATVSKIKNPTAQPNAPVPTISEEEELNALVVIATQEEIEQIKKLVAELDVPRQQVYVKAKIIEVSEERAEQIGLRYGIEAGGIGGTGLYSLGTNLTGGVSPATTLGALYKPSLPSNIDSAFMLGVSLDFLETNGAAEVLSEPSILCVNNKESTIYVGETRSILSTTSTTTAGIPTNSYTRQDIGLTLTVKPRLSTDNKVSLDVKATLEGIKTDNGLGTPTTTKRNVSTTAIVNGGEEVIIGGLIKNDESGARSKIPFLGDIPFLGGLFRSDTTSSSKTNLVIILTPYIVESSNDLGGLKAKLSDLDALQKKYNRLVLDSIQDHIKIDPDNIPAEETNEKAW
jgi:general secretion pathway protein D